MQYTVYLLQQKNYFLFWFFQLKLIMASNCEDVYLHNGVVVLTKEPTNRANLGKFLKESIRNGNFLEKTEFHLLCGFHTNENGEPLKSDPKLTEQFRDMLKKDLRTEIKKVPHMKYEISSDIILETEETGMHILTLFQAFQQNQIILAWQ